MKEIHQLTLSRHADEPYGFRIIGGKEQGRTFKVRFQKKKFWTTTYVLPGFNFMLMFQIEKVLTGFPADYGGVHEEDFLVSINGQDVFEMNHAQVVGLIKNSGATLRLAVER